MGFVQSSLLYLSCCKTCFWILCLFPNIFSFWKWQGGVLSSADLNEILQKSTGKCIWAFILLLQTDKSCWPDTGPFTWMMMILIKKGSFKKMEEHGQSIQAFCGAAIKPNWGSSPNGRCVKSAIGWHKIQKINFNDLSGTQWHQQVI